MHVSLHYEEYLWNLTPSEHCFQRDILYMKTRDSWKRLMFKSQSETKGRYSECSGYLPGS